MMAEREYDSCSLESKLKENLQQQLDELEMLESIFPKEFKYEESTGAETLRKFLKDNANDPPPFLDFTINISTNEDATTTPSNARKFEMCVTFPHDYPTSLPDIYIRNSEMTRTQSSTINKDCIDYLNNLERGEPCIYSAVLWLQDNAKNYDICESIIKPMVKDSDEKLVRLWIYSHHIYNKTKRREILYLAGRLNITGFCMPGKPGIICVEGHESDCNEWWASIRSMTWQKIMCKCTEDAKTRRFESFEEVAFQTHGARNNHSNLGELFKYLDEHHLAFIFKELFGIEGGK